MTNIGRIKKMKGEERKHASTKTNKFSHSNEITRLQLTKFPCTFIVFF